MLGTNAKGLRISVYNRGVTFKSHWPIGDCYSEVLLWCLPVLYKF